MDKDRNLFSTKELYLAEHSLKGSSYRKAQIPKRQRRKMIYDNMHLMEGMTFTPNFGFPQMSAYTGTTDFVCVSYSDRKLYDGRQQALHFFLDDYRFRDPVWCGLEETTFSIRNFDYYFTPDLSLWRDVPTEHYNRQNIYRSRFIGAYWQHCGYAVIPTASWGGMNSFTFCFEGLPTDSIIAVSGMGNRENAASFNLWCYGLRRLEEAVHPVLILVYGEEVDVPDLHTPLKFLPDFISTKLRKL